MDQDERPTPRGLDVLTDDAREDSGISQASKDAALREVKLMPPNAATTR